MTDNQYQQMLEETLNKACKTCGGAGELNDADPGDTWFRTWQCPDCLGTGIGNVVCIQGVKK